ncbi:hypothetical protein P5F12_03855 [Clostridium perfringens]|nr:hypothetical protein [Clostridium perfringens]
MNGNIKVLTGIYPVTRAEAVYIDDKKTLKEAIETGELGGNSSVNINGRGETIFILRSGEINIRNRIDNLANSSTIDYSFPTYDSDRVRRLFVYPSGGSMKTIDIPDGSLESHYALIYNSELNTLETKRSQWGSMGLNNNEYILLFNSLGNISGILSHHCNYGDDNKGFPIKSIEAEEYSSSGSTQGIFQVDGEIYKCYHATDDHSLFDGNINGKKHNICHMNALYYNQLKDMLIVGNGSKSYSLPMKGWIFPNWKNTYNTLEQLDINVIPKIELDFSQFQGEYKAQLCWGYDNSDIIYLATSDNRVIRKLKLTKNQEGQYTGEYQVLKTYYSRTTDIIGGMLFYNGNLYFGVKGEYGIRKCILKSNGFFDSEYIQIENKIGDMQGLAIVNNFLYAYTDSKGYKFNCNVL